MAHRLYQRVDNGALEPGEFRVEADDAGTRVVSIACPRCGHVSQLAHPGLRWPCASESCPFVDYLQIEEILR